MNFLIKNIKQRYKLRDYRFSLVFLVITLSVIGIFMVGSARPDLMERQIMGVALGAAAMFVISMIDYKWVLSLYWPLYILNIIMLVAVFFFGTERRNALAGSRVHAVPAFRPHKDPDDPVLCKVSDGTGAEH